MYAYVFTQPLWSTAGCLTKAKEPSPSYNLYIVACWNRWIHTFSNGISDKWTANRLVWTRIVRPISYDDKRFTKHTSGITTLVFKDLSSGGCVLDSVEDADSKSTVKMLACQELYPIPSTQLH